jgi:hypothetical protein
VTVAQLHRGVRGLDAVGRRQDAAPTVITPGRRRQAVDHELAAADDPDSRPTWAVAPVAVGVAVAQDEGTVVRPNIDVPARVPVAVGDAAFVRDLVAVKRDEA